ncbi:MAG: phage integrase SAM-like domain-containing protein [Dysgonomonas sp.]|uniref:site-specific integrase n=1 Tax=Dysgonomonas sp. TaxID=1891233 RepID=UPI0039E22B3F
MKTRGLRIGIIKQHLSLVNKIEEYGKIVTLEDLTYNNIDAFDKHMSQNAIKDITLHKRHTILSSYLKEAVRKGLLRQNPYDVFNPKRGKSKDPVFLTDLELRRIEDWVPTTDKMSKVKDLFLFQCYKGMAYSDMSKFDKSEIYKEGDYDVIRSSRTKTDERFVTLLLLEAKIILEKYSYNLPLMSNQKYNDYLKVLMTFVLINKSATSHTARHTYAVFLLNKGVPIEAVSVALGHTNIK